MNNTVTYSIYFLGNITLCVKGFPFTYAGLELSQKDD